MYTTAMDGFQIDLYMTKASHAGITKFVFYFSAEPSESAIEIINDFQQDFDIVFVNFKP